MKIFQIFNLILQSVQIFGQKLTLGQEKQVELRGGKSHIKTSRNGQHAEEEAIPIKEACNNNHQGLILVKFAKLSLPYEPMANTTIKRYNNHSTLVEY